MLNILLNIEYPELIAYSQRGFEMTDNKYNDYFISNYDFSLFERVTNIINRLIPNKDDNSKFIKIVDLPNINLISDKDNLLLIDYVNMIYSSDKHITINPDYFLLNDDNSRLITKDLRIILNENGSGKIPKHIKHKVASLCLLMLVGQLDEPSGQHLINELIKGYGVAELTYQAKGFLYINFLSKSVDKSFEYRGLFRSEKPGSGN